jgi:hypothetical protein
LPTGFTATRLGATFTCSTAAGFSSAALLVASAAGMSFSASAAATTVTRLLFLFFGGHLLFPSRLSVCCLQFCRCAALRISGHCL